MSIVSGTVGAILGSKAQKDANRTNKAIADEANRINMQMFQESRGSGGSSILPTYLDPGSEKLIANRAASAAMAMFPNDPKAQLAQYQSILASMQPAIDAGTAQIADIYNGNLEMERAAALAPVLEARTAGADANVDAINLALAEAQGRIAANEAAKGYSGGGSFANNRMLQAILQARQQGAREKASAALQNAVDKRMLSDAMSGLRLSSVDSAVNRAAQLTQAAQVPQMALGNLSQAATRPLDFFRIQPQAFRVDQQPFVSAVPGAAQLAMQGLSQTGGQVLGAYLQSNGTLFGGKGWGSTAGSGAALNKTIMPGGV